MFNECRYKNTCSWLFDCIYLYIYTINFCTRYLGITKGKSFWTLLSVALKNKSPVDIICNFSLILIHVHQKSNYTKEKPIYISCVYDLNHIDLSLPFCSSRSLSLFLFLSPVLSSQLLFIFSPLNAFLLFTTVYHPIIYYSALIIVTITYLWVIFVSYSSFT